jgi:hypothetical protein
MKKQIDPHACASEGCPRTAPAGEAFCETCAIERSLFDRDAREVAADDEAHELERSLFRRDIRADAAAGSAR